MLQDPIKILIVDDAEEQRIALKTILEDSGYEIYFSENDFENSLSFANKSLSISQELDLPETWMNSEKLLSEIYEKKGDKENAFLHFKKYSAEKENFQKSSNEKERLKTELNFQYEKKQYGVILCY